MLTGISARGSDFSPRFWRDWMVGTVRSSRVGPDELLLMSLRRRLHGKEVRRDYD